MDLSATLSCWDAVNEDAVCCQRNYVAMARPRNHPFPDFCFLRANFKLTS
jgi:hypothetical protein